MTDDINPELPPLPEPAAWRYSTFRGLIHQTTPRWVYCANGKPRPDDAEPLYTRATLDAAVAAAVAAEQAEASRLRLALLAISTAAQTNPAARRLACDVLAANAIRATAPKGQTHDE